MWEPTLRAVLQQKRPMLFTSFDEQDQAQDVACLQALALDMGVSLSWTVEPSVNPFRSLKLDAHSNVKVCVTCCVRLHVSLCWMRADIWVLDMLGALANSTGKHKDGPV